MSQFPITKTHEQRIYRIGTLVGDIALSAYCWGFIAEFSYPSDKFHCSVPSRAVKLGGTPEKNENRIHSSGSWNSVKTYRTGGAERLVVDAAISLQERNHTVSIYTSHHDPLRCFSETCNGQLDIKVAGDIAHPSWLKGRFFLPLAILRNLVLVLNLLQSRQKYDVIFIDQLSFWIPLLKVSMPNVKLLFYCHFPDFLLSAKGSLLKQAYRLPLDFLEQLSTGCADEILVNSKFTQGVFQQSFKYIPKTPSVLYPCVTDLATSTSFTAREMRFVSINRFERKKNIETAIRAFVALDRKDEQLIVVGGYDPRSLENTEYLEHLVSLLGQLPFQVHHSPSTQEASLLLETSKAVVLFLTNISAETKVQLLQSCIALVYTPPNEHFGIVPIESMSLGCPVIAMNSGGPTESILDGITGFLAEDETAMLEKMKLVLNMPADRHREMGRLGMERVRDMFSRHVFGEKLERFMIEMSASQFFIRAFLMILALLVAALIKIFFW